MLVYVLSFDKSLESKIAQKLHYLSQSIHLLVSGKVAQVQTNSPRIFCCLSLVLA